ncbi:MAG: hypothetical protein D6732_07500, partial [Methanobacteriota archaeon]
MKESSRNTNSKLVQVQSNMGIINIHTHEVIETGEKHYITIHYPKPREIFIERNPLKKAIKQKFDSGQKWIVLYGEKGLGKTTFAKWYFDQVEKEYEQVGWINYALSLSNSIATALALDPVIDSKTPEFYNRYARILINTFRNNPKKRFLVIDDITDWEDIWENRDLLDLSDTDILFTSSRPCPKDLFCNIELPPLTREETLHILKNYTEVELDWKYLQNIESDPWLMQIVGSNIPRHNAKAARQFVINATKGLENNPKQENRLTLARNILQMNPLDAAEYWVLLQLAALPNGEYEPDLIACYLEPEKYARPFQVDEENVEEEDIEPDPSMSIEYLSGFTTFLEEAGQFPEPSNYRLDAIMQRLGEKGWLTALEEGAFTIHDETRRVLLSHLPVTTAYFPELTLCLEFGFFSRIYNLFADSHQYERHLLHFLEFFRESPNTDYLDILWKLAQFYKDTIQYEKERETRLRHLNLAKQLLNPEGQEMIEIYTGLVHNHIRLDGKENLLKAEKFGLTALQIAQNSFEPKAPVIGSVKYWLGRVYHKLMDLPKAEKYYNGAISIYLANYSEDNVHSAASYEGLALVLQDLGELQQAKILFNKVIAIREKHLGPDHPLTANSYNNLAIVLKDLGELQQAKILFNKAIAIKEKHLGPDHPLTAYSYNNLAIVLKDLGELQQAKILFNKAF